MIMYMLYDSVSALKYLIDTTIKGYPPTRANS